MECAELLSTPELAHRLKLSVATVRRWRSAGIIPCIRLSSTTYRYDWGQCVSALRDRSDGQKQNPAATAA